MNKSEMIKWLQNLKKDIGQPQHQDLWHYAEILDEVIGIIEVSEDAISRKWMLNEITTKVESDDSLINEQKDSLSAAKYLIRHAPPVVPQQKEGEWLRQRIVSSGRKIDMVVCPNCREEYSYDAETGVSMGDYRACPNCGCRMKGVRATINHMPTIEVDEDAISRAWILKEMHEYAESDTTKKSAQANLESNEDVEVIE